MNEMKLRTIKSFVRRQGRNIPLQEQTINDYWPLYGLNVTVTPLDFTKVFSVSAPVVLEIGFGMGDSLFKQAKDNPTELFIGVEVHRPGVAKLLRTLRDNPLGNLKVFCEDALDVLHKSIPEKSLHRVQIFFPDPWPKSKHQKRRLIQQDFVALIRSKLTPGGILHLCTDWENYAEHMLAVMENAPGFRALRGPEEYHQRPAYRPLTKYEQRGQKLGHEIWDFLYERSEIPPTPL